jgi:hypothetical protein
MSFSTAYSDRNRRSSGPLPSVRDESLEAQQKRKKKEQDYWRKAISKLPG